MNRNGTPAPPSVKVLEREVRDLWASVREWERLTLKYIAYLHKSEATVKRLRQRLKRKGT